VLSENRAFGRNVTIQASPLALSRHESAKPGAACPSQSTRTKVSYSCRNKSRSLSFEGRGA
jgi:hypothetical protein